MMEKLNIFMVLAEDELIFKELFRRALRKLNIGTDRLMHFKMAHACIEYIESKDIEECIAFIDINFDNSEKDGFDILQSFKENLDASSHKVKKIVVSTDASKVSIEKAKNLGAHAYLVKEVGRNIDPFIKRLDRCLNEIVFVKEPKTFTVYDN